MTRKLPRWARDALIAAIAAAAPLVLRRLGLVITMASIASVSAYAGANLVDNPSAGSQQASAPIRQAWLSKAGPFPVERVRVPCPGLPVDRSRPATGVGHTVEGSFESGLAVFRQHFAPHFLVGRDRAGVVRILQFCPLGEISAALENHAGGVETNRWARAQVEVAARSSASLWELDPGVMRAYAALVYQLRDSAGIPLARPFLDTLGPGVAASYGYARRSAGKWGRVAGWFNHGEVPENRHWDMGAFRWSRLLALAESFAPVVNDGHGAKPKPVAKPRPTLRPLHRIVARAAGKRVAAFTTRRPGDAVARLSRRGYTRIIIERDAKLGPPAPDVSPAASFGHGHPAYDF